MRVQQSDTWRGEGGKDYRIRHSSGTIHCRGQHPTIPASLLWLLVSVILFPVCEFEL